MISSWCLIAKSAICQTLFVTENNNNNNKNISVNCFFMFKALEQLSLTLLMMVMTGKDNVSSLRYLNSGLVQDKHTIKLSVLVVV